MLTALLLTFAAQAAPAPARLAAIEWQSAQLPRELAGHYTREFATMLRKRGVEVVSQDEIATLLSAERQRELLGCSDGNNACLVELANALGTAGTLIGSIAKLDQTLRVQLRVLDGRNGKILVETVAEAEGERKLLDALEDAANRISAALQPGAATVEVSAPSSLRRKAWAPAVAGGALIIGGAVMVGLAYGKKSEIEARPAGSNVEDLRGAGSTYQSVGWIGLGLGVAALAGAGAMYVFGEAPVTPVAVVTPTGAGFALGGTFP